MRHPMPLPTVATRFGATQAEGLGEVELAATFTAVHPIIPDWSVELCGSDADERALVVMPEDADDEIGPTYIIRHEAGQYQLERMRFDILEFIAEVDQFDELLAILRARIGTHALMVMPRTGLSH